MLKKYIFGAIAPVLAVASTGFAADHCETHSVIQGETLRLIAEQYYGTRELSPIIYEANVGIIGSDQNSIEIGMQIAIPCREGMQTSIEKAFSEFMETQAALSGKGRPDDLVVSGIPMGKHGR